MALMKEEVVSALRTCVDPEIPINIVDLGLVYSVDISELGGEGGREVVVGMTLTSQGCPMSCAISNEVQRTVQQIPGVSRARVDLVWEPSWHPDMITAEGRKHLRLT